MGIFSTLPVVGTAVNLAHEDAAYLVHAWLFNAGSGTAVKDSVTDVDAVFDGTWDGGGGGNFNSTQKVEPGASGIPGTTAPWTVVYGVRFTSIEATNYHGIFGKTNAVTCVMNRYGGWAYAGYLNATYINGSAGSSGLVNNTEYILAARVTGWNLAEASIIGYLATHGGLVGRLAFVYVFQGEPDTATLMAHIAADPYAIFAGATDPVTTPTTAAWVVVDAGTNAGQPATSTTAGWVVPDTLATACSSIPAVAVWVVVAALSVAGAANASSVAVAAAWGIPTARSGTFVAAGAASATWHVLDATGAAGAAQTPAIATVAAWHVPACGSRLVSFAATHIVINSIERAVTRLDATLGIGVRLGSLAVDDRSGEATTARFQARGFTVEFGHEVVITNQQVPGRRFAGIVLTHHRSFLTENLRYPIEDVECISYAWLLNTRKVLGEYQNTSASAIARDLLAQRPGFTGAGIADDLPVIDVISFYNVDMTQAVKRLVQRIDGASYCDFYKDWHVFLTELEDSPVALTPTHPTARKVHATVDWSQVITRVLQEGGGSKTLAQVSPGETMIPLESTSWYEVDGATAVFDFETPETGLEGEGFTSSSAVTFVASSAHEGQFGANFPKAGAVGSFAAQQFAATIACQTAGTESICKTRFFLRLNTRPSVDAMLVGGVWWYSTHYVGLVVNMDGTFGATTDTAGAPSTAVLALHTWYEIQITVLVHNDISAYALPDQLVVRVAVYDEAGALIETVIAVQQSLSSPSELSLNAVWFGAPASPSGEINFDIDDAAYVVRNDVAFPAGAGLYDFHVTGTDIDNSPANTNAILSPSVNLVATGHQRIRYQGRLRNPLPGSLSQNSITLEPRIGLGVTPGQHVWASTFVTPAGESLASAPVLGATGLLTVPTAPGVGSTELGTGPESGPHQYATTFVTAEGESTPGPRAQKATGLLDPPAAPAVVQTWGAELGLGLYGYAQSFLTATGETTPSAVASVTTIDAIPDPTAAPTKVDALNYNGWFFPCQGSGGLGTDPGPDGTVGNVLRYAYSYGYDYSGIPTACTALSPSVDFTLEAVGLPHYSTLAPYGRPWVRAHNVVVPHSTHARACQIHLWRSCNGAPFHHITYVDNNRAGGTTAVTVWAAFSPPYNLEPGTPIANGRRSLITPTVGGTGVTGIRLWRTAVNASQLQLLAAVANAATPYADATVDGALGANAPTVNTATGFNRVPITVPLGPPGVLERNLWRTEMGDAALKLLANFPNNVTTAYLDLTLDASLGAAAPTVNTAVMNKMHLAHIVIGPPEVTGRKLYQSVSGDAALRFLALLNNNTTTEYDAETADEDLGADAPPEDTSGLPTTVVAGIVDVGAVSLPVADPAAYPSGGGWVVVNGQQVVRYGSIAGNALIGIPATGAGSIAVRILEGSTIAPAPQIVGIPATGAGSILSTIPSGENVNILVQKTDTAARAVLKALLLAVLGLHSDGIVEDYLVDGRIGLAEAKSRALANLTRRKDPTVTIGYECRDPLTRSGKTIPVDLPDSLGVVGDFKIQQVGITGFDEAKGLLPLYRVTASSTRFSFDDLLRIALRAS